MRSTKNVGGKLENMKKEELVEAFKAFDAKKGAQPLASPKTKLDKTKVRQTSKKYKVKRALRLKFRTVAQRVAERVRQRTEAYKEQKRARENAPEAKVKRKQRKLCPFWQDCFRRCRLLRTLRGYRISVFW